MPNSNEAPCRYCIDCGARRYPRPEPHAATCTFNRPEPQFDPERLLKLAKGDLAEAQLHIERLRQALGDLTAMVTGPVPWPREKLAAYIADARAALDFTNRES
jgi:hypothetical protein